MNRKKLVIILTLLLVYATAFGIYSMALDYFKNSKDVLSLSSSSFSDGETDLTYRCLNEAEAGSISFNAAFHKQELPAVAEEYCLIVYRMAGQSFKVYLNDIYLGAAGDYEGINSSIWNGMFIFEFDKRHLQENNQITLEIVGLYDIGLKSFPVIITENTNGIVINQYYQLFQVWLKAIFIGTLISGSIIMLAFYFTFFDSPSRQTFMLMALALFISIFYFIDFFTINLLPINFTLYKKLNITTVFVVVVLINFALISYFRMPKWRFVPYLTLAVSVCGAIFSRSIQQFKSWYDIYFLMLPANLLALMLMMAARKLRSQARYLLLIYNFTLVVAIIPAVFNLTFNFDLDIFYSTVHIFLIPMSVSAIIMVMTEMQKLRCTVSKENKRLKYFYNKSITDGLTGMYNYSFMLEYLHKIKPVYTVVLLDIDNLKEINDTLGHLAGNRAIIMIADALKNLLPKNSVVGRFGGDEFMAIIFVGENIAIGVMERVRLNIAASGLFNADPKVSISIGIYAVKEAEAVDEIIDKADQAMYYAKKTGKNCLVSYGEISDKNNDNS